MITIEEVEKKIISMGRLIDLPSDSNLYPYFSDTPNCISDDYTIYVDSDGYHYVRQERSKELKHYSSINLSDILFYFFYDVSFIIASDYELKNRKNDEDFRKILFTKQVELMYRISDEYGKKCQDEINKILEKYPYE